MLVIRRESTPHAHSLMRVPAVARQQLARLHIQQPQVRIQAGCQHTQPVMTDCQAGNRVVQVVCVHAAHTDVKAAHTAVHTAGKDGGAHCRDGRDIVLQAVGSDDASEALTVTGLKDYGCKTRKETPTAVGCVCVSEDCNLRAARACAIPPRILSFLRYVHDACGMYVLDAC